ncbi:MAG: EAL domain-containing protein [bacterium]|nr:EAL domain-containing protein [bacterium]
MESDITILVLALGVIIFAILFFTMWRRKNKVHADKKELEASYEELEDSYEVLSNQEKELMNLYDKSRQNEERLRKLAFVDTLTELPNRDAIVDEINEILKSMRPEDQIALMYLDVDNLKEVNDTLGYTYGDELLIDITYRIKQSLAENDLMARISGDEFVILSKDITDFSEYDEKIKKIMTVFNYPFSLAEKDYFVNMDIGVCKLEKEIKNAATAIKYANAAMDQAREIGKGQYYYFNEELKTKLMEQIQMQADVRTAFEKNEFFAVYQPVLDVQEHKVIGFESLLRWDHGEEGILSPGDFLEAAIESGIIVPLGISFLKKACKALSEWQKKGYSDLVLMVNLSERQLLDYDVVFDIDLILKESKVAPEKLIFDISEISFESNEQLVVQRIKELRELGVGICLDNFGSKKGALNRILESRFDFIKFDRSLLQSLATDEKHALFIKELGSLFETLDCTVIYEGIEEPEQLEKVEDFTSKLVQGFLFGNPLKEAEVMGYLETWMK